MKDKNGVEIELGQVVLYAINMNMRKYSNPWTIHICREDEKGQLFLDSHGGYIKVDNVEPEEACVLTPDVNLSSLYVEWHKRYNLNGTDRWERKYCTTEQAHDFYDHAAAKFGFSRYDATPEEMTRKLDTLVVNEKQEEWEKVMAQMKDVKNAIRRLQGSWGKV